MVRGAQSIYVSWREYASWLLRYCSVLWLTSALQIKDTDATHFDLDCQDLRAFDDSLYRQLVRYPQEVVPILDLVIGELFTDNVNSGDVRAIQTRPYNLSQSTNMRDLNPDGKQAAPDIRANNFSPSRTNRY